MNSYYSKYAKHWALDQEIIFLNHGSFGACPLPVLKKQNQLRMQLESNPMRFFTRESETLYFDAIKKLAELVNAQASDMVFVPNATYAVNSVLKSLDFEAGDEILTTNHTYPANKNILDFISKTKKVKIVYALIDFPVISKEDIIEKVVRLITPRTRLVLLDHITSPTGIRLPVEEIIPILNKKGIDSLIDGAHAVGSIPLDLTALKATYYTSNCHKWLCSPKGSAFLYVQPNKQQNIYPAVHSLPVDSRTYTHHSEFEYRFMWAGTIDLTAYLSIPAAIDFMGSLFPGGLTELYLFNHSLAIEARNILCHALKISAPCPDDMLTTLVSLPLPDAEKLAPFGFHYTEALQKKLYTNNIEVMITFFPVPPKRLIRVSAQVYNTVEQYRYLGKAIGEIANYGVRNVE